MCKCISQEVNKNTSTAFYIYNSVKEIPRENVVHQSHYKAVHFYETQEKT